MSDPTDAERLKLIEVARRMEGWEGVLPANIWTRLADALEAIIAENRVLVERSEKLQRFICNFIDQCDHDDTTTWEMGHNLTVRFGALRAVKEGRE